MTKEQKIADLIQADADAIYGMDQEDLWEAILNLLAAVYEGATDAEIDLRHAKLTEE